MNTLNRSVGVFTLRLLLGLLFLMQGYGKVFIFGVEQVYQNYFLAQYQDVLPLNVLRITAYYTSYAEIISGLLLLMGWKKNLAYYLLASVLIIVSFGHGLAEPIWNTQHVFVRAVFLIALLIIPNEWDKFSLDYWIKKLSKIKSNELE